MLGVLPDSKYESEKISLRQGDVLVLYTDGAVEAEKRFRTGEVDPSDEFRQSSDALHCRESRTRAVWRIRGEFHQEEGRSTGFQLFVPSVAILEPFGTDSTRY